MASSLVTKLFIRAILSRGGSIKRLLISRSNPRCLITGTGKSIDLVSLTQRPSKQYTLSMAVAKASWF